MAIATAPVALLESRAVLVVLVVFFVALIVRSRREELSNQSRTAETADSGRIMTTTRAGELLPSLSPPRPPQQQH